MTRKHKRFLSSCRKEITYDDVKEVDVLFGRNRSSHGHRGNEQFRQLIRDFRYEYQNTNLRKNKKAVTNCVIAAIKEDGGRFMMPCGSGCIEATTAQIYEKVSHALRSSRIGKTKDTQVKKSIHLLSKKKT